MIGLKYIIELNFDANQMSVLVIIMQLQRLQYIVKDACR